MAHEVVSQVKVGDVLTVKQVFRHLLQAVAGQVHHADGLRHHLRGARGHRVCMFALGLQWSQLGECVSVLRL